LGLVLAGLDSAGWQVNEQAQPRGGFPQNHRTKQMGADTTRGDSRVGCSRG
jgi:hypothetical protein